MKLFKKKRSPIGSITLGVEVKNCRECNRGDCDQCGYKHEFERLMALPNCNTCRRNAPCARTILTARTTVLDGDACPIRPKLGEDIRINCPYWQPKKEGEK